MPPSPSRSPTDRPADTDGQPSSLTRRQALARAAQAALATSAALGASSLLSACGKGKVAAAEAKASAPTADLPPGTKVYAIGTDASYEPFESQNEKGDFIGFDVELIQGVAKAAGIEIELINTPWEGLVTALEQGDLDAAISAIAITEERRLTLEFTSAYFEAQQMIVVPNASKVQRLRDLKAVRTGVQLGAAGDDLAAGVYGKETPALQRFESVPLALAELEGGRVDAVLADNGVLAHYVTHNGSTAYRLVNDPGFEMESYGMAVKKGNSELLAKLEQGLMAMRADGSYATLVKRYFGDALQPAAKAASK